MNDRQLKYILTIAKEKNLSAAARKLYISQPSLSNLLDSVEKELGIKLFERRSSGMIPTAAGELYIQAAQRILGIISDLDQQLSEIKDQARGKLAIGSSQKKSALLFPYIIPRLKQLYPLYSIKLVEETMEVLAEMLTAGDLDIAFLYSNYDIPNTEAVLFSREEVTLVGPSSFSSGKLIQKSDGNYCLSDYSILNGEPFAIFKKGRNLRAVAEQIFSDLDIHPDIILETDSWQACLGMVANDEAFTVLPIDSMDTPEFKARHLGQFKIIHTPKIYERKLSVFYRSGLRDSQILRDFLSICENTENHGDYSE